MSPRSETSLDVALGLVCPCDKCFNVLCPCQGCSAVGICPPEIRRKFCRGFSTTRREETKWAE
jgi:hypothetical protein